jgi:OOP family OmpA-OmpF porin
VLAPQLVHADLYLGAKIGYSTLEDACALDEPCSDDSASGGFFAGYNFNDYIALEAGADMLGSFKTNFSDGPTVADDNLDAVTLAPKITLPLGDFDIFGKLGAAWVDYDNQSDSALMGAVGVEYNFSKNLAARFEYQRINNVSVNYIDNLDVDSFFLGLTYTFASDNKAVVTPAAIAEPAPKPAAVVEPEPVLQTKLFREFGVELFDTDSATLKEDSLQYFDWFVGVMQKYPQAKAQIIGHTDSRGSEAYNQVLSERRAAAVADYLYANGIDESRVTVLGEGESKPKASNDTKEGRLENRRVEVIIEEFEYQE